MIEKEQTIWEELGDTPLDISVGFALGFLFALFLFAIGGDCDF